MAGKLFGSEVHIPPQEEDELLRGLGQESFNGALTALVDIAHHPSDPDDEEDDRRACETAVRTLIHNIQVLANVDDAELVNIEKTLRDILSRPLPDDLPGKLGNLSRTFSVNFGRLSGEMLPQSNGVLDLGKNLILLPQRAINHLTRNAVSLFRTDPRRRLEELRNAAALEIQARTRRK